MSQLSEALIGELKGSLREHPGESQVFLHIGDRQVLRLPDQFCADLSGGFVGQLRVFGPDALVS